MGKARLKHLLRKQILNHHPLPSFPALYLGRQKFVLPPPIFTNLFICLRPVIKFSGKYIFVNSYHQFPTPFFPHSFTFPSPLLSPPFFFPCLFLFPHIPNSILFPPTTIQYNINLWESTVYRPVCSYEEFLNYSVIEHISRYKVGFNDTTRLDWRKAGDTARLDWRDPKILLVGLEGSSDTTRLDWRDPVILQGRIGEIQWYYKVELEGSSDTTR